MKSCDEPTKIFSRGPNINIEQAPDAVKISDIIGTENVKDDDENVKGDDASKSTFQILMMCPFLQQHYKKGPFQNREVIVSPSMTKDLEPKVETKIKEADEEFHVFMLALLYEYVESISEECQQNLIIGTRYE